MWLSASNVDLSSAARSLSLCAGRYTLQQADNLLLLRIKSQGRSQEAHVILLKDRSQDLGIGGATARKRSKLFVKLMAAPWCVHDDDLAWLIGDIEECVRDL